MCIGIEQFFKLRCWIDETKLDIENLCYNENAVVILEKRIHEISYYLWCVLCEQESMSILNFVDKHINLIDKLNEENSNKHLKNLCENPCSINILKNNEHYKVVFEDEIYLTYLSRNPNAMDIVSKKIHLFKNHGNHIIWLILCRNPNGVDIVKNYLYKLNRACWDALCENPNAKSLLLSHYKKINFKMLCWNKNKEILDIVEKNIDFDDEVMIHFLCLNSSAMYIIKNKIELFINKFNTNTTSKPSIYLWDSLCYNDNLHEILDIPEVHNKIKNSTVLHLFMRNNQHALKYFKDYVEKDDFMYICENKYLIEYIEENFNKYDDDNDNEDSIEYGEDYIYKNEFEQDKYANLSLNPSIFTYNYELMINSKKEMHKDYKKKYYMLNEQKYINKYNCNIILEYL